RRHTTCLSDWSSDVCSSDLYVTGGMEPAGRAAGYAADVTYATSREVVADYLRDRIFLGLDAADGLRRLVRMMHGGRAPTAGVVKIGRAACRGGVESGVVGGG